MTKLFGLSCWRMELSFLEMERSQEKTGLGMGQEFPLGHGEFEMSLTNQRRYQGGDCIHESRIQDRSVD